MGKLSAVLKDKKKERVIGAICDHVYKFHDTGSAYEFTCAQCGHKLVVNHVE